MPLGKASCPSSCCSHNSVVMEVGQEIGVVSHRSTTCDPAVAQEAYQMAAYSVTRTPYGSRDQIHFAGPKIPPRLSSGLKAAPHSPSQGAIALLVPCQKASLPTGRQKAAVVALTGPNLGFGRAAVEADQYDWGMLEQHSAAASSRTPPTPLASACVWSEDVPS